MKWLLAVTGFLAFATVANAEQGVGGRDGGSNFDRTHDAIDRNMKTGNDRSPPLGEGKGERTGIGGGRGGGADRGTDNDKAIKERNQ